MEQLSERVLNASLAFLWAYGYLLSRTARSLGDSVAKYKVWPARPWRRQDVSKSAQERAIDSGSELCVSARMLLCYGYAGRLTADRVDVQTL